MPKSENLRTKNEHNKFPYSKRDENCMYCASSGNKTEAKADKIKQIYRWCIQIHSVLCCVWYNFFLNLYFVIFLPLFCAFPFICWFARLLRPPAARSTAKFLQDAKINVANNFLPNNNQKILDWPRTNTHKWSWFTKCHHITKAYCHCNFLPKTLRWDAMRMSSTATATTKCEVIW